MRLSDGQRKVLYREGYYARYVPSGHLAFLHQGTLFAAPFDPESLELMGEPVPVLEDVKSSRPGGSAEFAFIRDGSLIYQKGGIGVANVPVWVDRAGGITAWETQAADFPRGEGKVQISTEGGFQPMWSRPGDELFFYIFQGGQLRGEFLSEARQTVMNVVSYQDEDGVFRTQSPESLFSGFFVQTGLWGGPDLAPDGQRFVMLQAEEGTESGLSQLVLIQNWFEELPKVAPDS